MGDFKRIDNVNITEHVVLVQPKKLIREVSPEPVEDFIHDARRRVNDIIYGHDDRLLVVVGPCSIHDIKAGIEYANKLVKVAGELSEDLYIVMRVYFEKPRTTHGWRGLINDPGLNNTFRINDGLHMARQILCDINKIGLPCGVEFLDVILPQFLADMVSWGAIGARTTESQIHREMASGLSAAVGFKNGTDGSTLIAAQAILASNRANHFLSVTKKGEAASFATRGNRHTHIILRGGNGKPNYSSEHVEKASLELAALGLPARLMIDCSHANSGKDYMRQLIVAEEVGEQIADGDLRILGLMIESNLVEGRQEISEKLTYGQSITDACLGWDDTVTVLHKLAAAARLRRQARAESD